MSNKHQKKRVAERWEDKETVEVRFVYNKGYVGTIIGKKAAKIKEIKKKSKARVLFGPDFPPVRELGRELQEAKLGGNLNQLKKAVKNIGDVTIKIDEERAEKGQDALTSAKFGDIQVTIVLPADNIAMLIGKKGFRIKKLTKEFKAIIDIQEEDFDGVKCVTFTGAKENVAEVVASALKALPLSVFASSGFASSGRGDGRGGRSDGRVGRGGGRGEGRGEGRGGWISSSVRNDDRGYGPPADDYAPHRDYYPPPPRPPTPRDYYNDGRDHEMASLRATIDSLEQQLHAPSPRDRGYYASDPHENGYGPVRGPRPRRRGPY